MFEKIAANGRVFGDAQREEENGNLCYFGYSRRIRKFMELLEEIELEENDTLYVLGDVLDRGKHPIKTVLN